MRFNIKAQLDALLQRKGGYVDNANDRGGPTMYGITRTTALAKPQWGHGWSPLCQ